LQLIPACSTERSDFRLVRMALAASLRIAAAAIPSLDRDFWLW
jgi:hypothetical protein